MSRRMLSCPRCGEHAPPPITVPNPVWYTCPACGERTPRMELDSVEDRTLSRWTGALQTTGSSTPVLLQTLFWSADPVFTITDINGTGAFETRSLTAAESHDNSDLTYHETLIPGSFGDATEGHATTSAERSVTTCTVTGTITKLVLRGVSSVSVIGGSGMVFGTIAATVNGVALDVFIMSDVFGINTSDSTVNPADGLAWTAARVNAATFGLIADGSTIDPGVFGTTAAVRVSEFSIQVWGTP